jgi:thiol-disulfide isomerase/thioredoxin
MKIVLLLLPLLLTSVARAESGCVQKVYPICSDQMELTKNALAKAEKAEALVLFTFGADWCPWCISLEGILSDQKWLETLPKNMQRGAIALFRERKRIASGTSALDLIARMDPQLDREKLKGIPILVLVNPAEQKAIFIDTASLEKNSATQKGHDPIKLAEAIRKSFEKLEQTKVKPGNHARP